MVAKASYGFCSRRHTRALRLAGMVAAFGGCTDPTFVPADAAASMRQEREEAGPADDDAGGPPDTEPVIQDGGVEEGSDAQVRADAASEDAAVAPTDGGPPSASATDAAPSAALPAWALDLVGTYAKRSINFSYDDYEATPTNTRNEESSILKIAQSGSTLTVSIQLCGYTVTLRDLNDPLIFKYPSRYPPLTGKLELDATTRTFSSAAMVGHLGFAPERGRDCAGGRRQRYDDQSWNATTCACSAGSIPVAIDDCRVTDTDGDMKAGITARNPLGLGSYADVMLVFDYSVAFSDGQVKTTGRHELRETRAQSPACLSTSGACSVGKNQLCPGGYVKLIQLSKQVTDADCDDFPHGEFGPPDPAWPMDVDCRTK